MQSGKHNGHSWYVVVYHRHQCVEASLSTVCFLIYYVQEATEAVKAEEEVAMNNMAGQHERLQGVSERTAVESEGLSRLKLTMDTLDKEIKVRAGHAHAGFQRHVSLGCARYIGSISCGEWCSGSGEGEEGLEPAA